MKKLTNYKNIFLFSVLTVIIFIFLQRQFIYSLFEYPKYFNSPFENLPDDISDLIFNRLKTKDEKEETFSIEIANSSLHQNLYSLSKAERNAHIAIGGGITSSKVLNLTINNIADKMAFFTTFLPSFCSTASKGYFYHFYLAYDYKDSFFNNSNFLEAFSKLFSSFFNNLPCSIFNSTLHLIRCTHNHKPAWAQNDAMMRAYLDGVCYFYRINDDSLLKTSGWTEIFIKRLSKFKPPNLGVVGPKHSGGNLAILTYDFVHRTHINVFGFYYPRLFTDWFADSWITLVYKPENMEKMEEVKLSHMMSLGTRYIPDYKLGKILNNRINFDKNFLKRYKLSRKFSFNSRLKKVICFYLYGINPRISMGVIRNAQLISVYFSEWKMKVYIFENKNFQFKSNTTFNFSKFNFKNESNFNSSSIFYDYSNTSFVPQTTLNFSLDFLSSQLQTSLQIIRVLEDLGVEIVRVDEQIASHLPVQVWPYLVLDDPQVDLFAVREPEYRLSERDFMLVNDFISKSLNDNQSSIAFHCIRDRLEHKHLAIVRGLWGGVRKRVKQLLNGQSIKSLLLQFFNKPLSFKKDTFQFDFIEPFLFTQIWLPLKKNFLCHDSVSCSKWKPYSISFPLHFSTMDFKLGTLFNSFHIPDLKLSKEQPSDNVCLFNSSYYKS